MANMCCLQRPRAVHTIHSDQWVVGMEQKTGGGDVNNNDMKLDGAHSQGEQL